LFLLVALATGIVVLVTLVNLMRRRFASTGRLLLRHGLALALYFLILLAVSLASPQRVVPMNEDRCFDDWCIAVENVQRKKELGGARPEGIFYVVDLKLSNHSRGRAQRAGSVAIHLMNDQGNSFDVSLQGQAALEAQPGSIPPLTSTIEAGGSVMTHQVFDLPVDARNIVLTVEHPVGFSPGWFIIGDEDSLFHKPTIVRLPR
jgi:hypothetical protein